MCTDESRLIGEAHLSIQGNPPAKDTGPAFRHTTTTRPDQLSRLVEEGKKTGLFDPAVSTTAISLLCQSLGLGSHLLLTAALSDRHIPGEDEWIDLLWKLLTAVAPHRRHLTNRRTAETWFRGVSPLRTRARAARGGFQGLDRGRCGKTLAGIWKHTSRFAAG